MKKSLLSGFSFFFLFLIFFIPLAHAASSSLSNPTISDAVYADLATRGYLDNMSVSFFDGTQNSFGINETKHWLPASTVKLFAAMYAFKLIGEGKLHVSDNYTADWKNVVPTELVTLELPTIQAGDTLSLDRLLRQMITQSDNTAFNIMLDILKRKDVTNYMQTLGLAHTTIGSKLNLDTSQTQFEFDDPGYGINSTTSDEYTTAFRLIWENKIPGAKPLLEILKQQKINYMLPLLLPKDIVVAHKTGDLDPLYHDGGVIFGPKNTYVLSIFSNAGDPNLVAHISELVYSQNYALVGQALNTISPQNQGGQNGNFLLDPLVTQGKTLPSKYILGASTKAFTQALPPQPITAADLGITAQDLSLAQSETQLPSVAIPADSPFHIFVTFGQTLQHNFAFTKSLQEQADIHATLLQLAEAKDLTNRKKIQEANTLLQNIHKNITTFVQEGNIKNNTQIQTAIQAISETRFQVYADALKTTSGQQRNTLITEIGQQAKEENTNLQPQTPLATNAINPNQRPLIGQVVRKTNTDVIVQTAGGQQVTVPLNNQDITIKTKTVTPAFFQSSPSATQAAFPTLSPTPSEEPSLATVNVGSTVALVGSSVGNTFTPTFVLTNVPRELAAPEPVVVVNVNQKAHTMVISENGVPVQVNVGAQTIIHGNDTNLALNAIQPGDVVLVHGEPLTPLSPTPTANVLTPTPTGEPISQTQSSVQTSSAPSLSPTGAQFLIAPSTATKSGEISLTPVPTPATTITQSKQPGTLTTPTPSQKMTGNSAQLSPTKTLISPLSKQPINNAQPSSTPVQSKGTTQSTPTSPPVQPKVIKGMSIQIIEKGVDTNRNQSISSPTTKIPPPPLVATAAPQPSPNSKQDATPTKSK